MFFFNDTATTEIYTLSLHDALPIWREHELRQLVGAYERAARDQTCRSEEHTSELQSRFGISYAVFCLKKKTPRLWDRRPARATTTTRQLSQNPPQRLRTR